MISIYGEVLSTIEKTLQELMEEYQGVGKFLQDLVEGQKRNMVQLERIRAVIEWRWGLEEENEKEESEDEKKGSKDSPRESWEEKILLSVFC